MEIHSVGSLSLLGFKVLKRSSESLLAVTGKLNSALNGVLFSCLPSVIKPYLFKMLENSSY